MKPTITITPDTTYRAQITVDGTHYGKATYGDDDGWSVFQGKFPNARRIFSGCCTLLEVEREVQAIFEATADALAELNALVGDGVAA